MPSYTQYKRQMAVLDADDSEIESWITVRGNHIPIMKGQSKGDAVKAFIEKKSGSGGAKKEVSSSPKFKVISGAGKTLHEAHSQQEAESWAKENVNKVHSSLGVVSGYKKYKEYEPRKYEHKLAGAGRAKKEYDPAFEIDRKNALANYYMYGGKYTQRSKQAAYKEWKHDTSSEENLRAANKWVNSELVAKQSKPSDSMGRPPKKKYEGQTLGEMEKGGADVSGLRQDLNRWYYGFYVEEARKMTPQQLVDWMEDMVATTTKRNNLGEIKIQEVFPDLIKKVKGHIKNMQGGSEKKLSKPSDSSKGGNTSQPKDIHDWKFEDVMKLKSSDPRVHKYIAENFGVSKATVAILGEVLPTEDLYFKVHDLTNMYGEGWDRTSGGKRLRDMERDAAGVAKLVSENPDKFGYDY